MDQTRNGGICRRFINGSCRFGTRCYYRHERPSLIPSFQIPCRYFQKGGCWYGERCQYLHITAPAAVAGRRGSVPAVSSSSVAPPDRRGSEPALLQAGVTSRSGSSRNEPVVSNPQQNIERLPPNIAEEQTKEDASEAVQSLEVVQADECQGTNEETSSSESSEDGAAAAAAACSAVDEVEETMAPLQSKNMTCGICMDKVYEKTDPKDRVFAILPNCSHSFCLHCIMTWRKTRDLGPDVVKSCPQCRVRSPFYVPNKSWVEGQAKETVVAAFKEKFSKKSCSYYARYRRCPFKTDCLYRHDKHAHHSLFPYPPEDEDEDDDDYEGVDLLNFLLAMTLLRDGVVYDDDDDEDFDLPFYLSDEYGF
ncbi:makorin, ring finger protein, 4 [Parambassis ranga]|uniref:RING-type E3 ubiquitin transferase n=1 Tax=Parambassis ranga TaxID=210632 RepID=A0A6P7IW86_9TELE|nr:probable E3 ubiquitin-protein ligase makorin-2 [Parambassis ranga]